MPCQSDGYGDGGFAKITRLTQMLCATCKTLEERGLLDAAVGNDVVDWWDDHKRADEIRAQRERQRAEQQETALKALSKLNAAELRALGYLK